MPRISEPCPSCRSPIPVSAAYCLTCGSARGVSESTPLDVYLRSCVAALELVREAHRRARPLAETRRAEAELDRAVGILRGIGKK